MGSRWLQQGHGGLAWRALFLQFYSVFIDFMHLGLWLIILELGGAHGGPGNGTWLFYCSFIVFFEAQQEAASKLCQL